MLCNARVTDQSRDREPLERNSWRFGIFSCFVSVASIVSAASSESWLRIAIVIGSTLVLGSVAVFLIEGRARRRDRSAANDPIAELTRRSERFQEAYDEFADYLEKVQQVINEQKATRDGLIAQAERVIDEQKAARDALLAQVEEQQRLLRVDRAQVEAINRILLADRQRAARVQRTRELMFVAFGVLASIPIGILINLVI